MTTSPGSFQDASRSSETPRRLRLVRRRWKLIAAVFVLTTGTALALALSEQKMYSATASLLFRDPALDQTLFGANFLNPSADPAREAATNVRLVGLSAVARRTARALGEPPLARRVRRALDGRRLTDDDISTRIDIAPEGQSDLASVTFSDRSPEIAALVANVFATQYVAFRRDADRLKVEEAQDLVDGQLAEMSDEERTTRQGRLLEDRAQQLAILRSLQTGNAEVAQPAEQPSAPSSPRPARSAVLGGFFGLLLGLGLAWLRERFDRRLRDPDEALELFDRPLLGSIPQGRLGRKQRDAAMSPGETEAFLMVRASLRYFNVNRPLRSVLITSASPGEGKTSVSWNLAAAATATGTRVLLLESDLRRPTMASYFGLAPAPGLTNMLAADLALEDVVQSVPVTRTIRGASREQTMDVVTAGPLPPNPTDLLESERMRQIVAAAEAAYDLVVIDTPPTSVVSDAIPLLSAVSGVIVVLRLGYSRRDATQVLRDQLRNLEAPLLGVVINGVKQTQSNYGAGYGAGYTIEADPDEFREQLRAHKGGSRNGGGDASERSEPIGAPVSPSEP